MSALPRNIEIIRKMLMSAPPSELNEVIVDLQAILADDALFAQHIGALCTEYNERHGVIVNCEGEKVVLHAAGRAAGGYTSPSGAVFSIDPVKRVCTGVISPSPTALQDATQAALQKGADNHVAGYYPAGAAQVYPGAGAGEYILVVTAAAAELQSFWSGHWRAEYTLTVTGNTVALAGTIATRGHVFEAGNVMSEIADAVSLSATLDSLWEDLAGAERDFFAHLDVFYNEFSGQLFKSLRRALPIFKTKIGDRWANITSLTMM